MSKMIALLCFAVIMFSVAASGSWYLQYQQQQAAEGGHGDDKPAKPHAAPAHAAPAHAAPAHGAAAHGAPAHGAAPSAKPAAAHGAAKHAPAAPAHAKTPSAESTTPRPLLRPITTSDTDRITLMATALQQQQEQIKKREEQLQNREKQIDLIHQEVLKEQKKLDALRKDIQGELQLVLEKLDIAEKRAADGERERQKVEVQKDEMQKSIIEVNHVESKNLKQLATIYDKMDAEAASQSIQQMVEQGKLDMAASILSNMRDRSAANLLGDIAKQDSDIAVRLFDRIRQLKTPAPPTLTPKTGKE